MSYLRIDSQAHATPPVTERGHADLNWYAVYTRPNHEKRTAQQFDSRGIESYLPLYRAAHQWKNGCRVTVHLPLFPNYVFVHINPRDWVKVVEVSSVRTIVGTRQELLPLPEPEIETMRSGLHLCQAQPHPYLKVGARARIRSGPLAGMEGVITRTKESLRVILTIESIMRSFVVEIETHDLEPLPVQFRLTC